MRALMPAPSHESLWTRRFLWLLAGVLAFRVIYLFVVVDFQLSGDEAYYWDWGRRPDWCYYSKPPLIGWLMGALRVIFGYQWWAVRLAAIGLGSVSLTLLFLLGRRLFDARTGFVAALLFLLTPANAAANFAFTIDSPLVLCWTAALLLFWRVVEKPAAPLGWLALTLAIGVGTLAKQMMLVFPLVMLLFTLFSPTDRGLLKRTGFWLCIVGSLAFLLPVLWWNEHHGWITLKHTSEHFQHEELSFLGWLEQFFRFPLLQAATYSPITWGLMIAALIASGRAWKSLQRRERYLFLFSAPGLFVFLLLAMRQYINENWPAVYYLSAFVLGASFALSQASRFIWMQRGLKLGGALFAVIYVLIPAIPLLGWNGHPKLDPVAPLRGWQEAGRQVGALYAQVPRPKETFVLVLDHRHNASQMAFNMPQHPFVYRWNRRGRIESQYEIWPNASDKTGWDAFIVYPNSADDPEQVRKPHSLLREAFEDIVKIGDVRVDVGNGLSRSFQLLLGKNMKHWPETEASEPAETANKP